MISTLGWIMIVLILLSISLFIPNDNKDGCFEKDFFNCLNCKKDCKYHQIMENYENKTHEKLKKKDIF